MEKEIQFYLKGFWGRIFCKHNYAKFGDLIEYNSIEDKKNNLPSKKSFRFICKKCGKIKKYKIT